MKPVRAACRSAPKTAWCWAKMDFFDFPFMFLAAVFDFGFGCQRELANITNINIDYIKFTTYILVLDALVIIPFALLRAQGKTYEICHTETINVAINLGSLCFSF